MMNKKEDIIKRLKLNKKSAAIVIIAVFAAVLLVISELMPTESKNEKKSGVSAATLAASEYIKSNEQKLEKLISAIDGAGEAEVMITLESCYENVYAKGYSTKNENDDGKSSSDVTEEYIIVKNGSNTESCLVVKVYEPQIKGVAVVAQGAENAAIKKAITDTVTAVFGISSTKVSVEKMKYTKEK